VCAQALVINEFAGETFTCDAPVPPQDADPGVTSTGCIRTGEQEIEMLSFQVSTGARSAGVRMQQRVHDLLTCDTDIY
jgi:hypothetical protein